MKIVLEKILITVFSLAVIAAFVYTVWQYQAVAAQLSALNAAHEQTTKTMSDQEIDRNSTLAQKDAYISFLESENADINRMLSEERNKGEQFEQQVSIIGKTIAEIQKIQNTDAELLKKYSKIYFLNENYKPSALATIPNQYLANKKSLIEIHAKVEPHLIELIKASENSSEASPIRVISGFRSFEEQKILKTTYKVTYGSGANKFSADQGYSEHQLGTTVDLSTEKLGLGYTSFANSNTFTWMQAHAHQYGFILSYPKGNTHYQYEPWHWRFVGVDLATALYDKKINFYDMNQREIDSYIGKLFD